MTTTTETTDFVLRIGGESGDGMVTIGDIITAVAALNKCTGARRQCEALRGKTGLSGASPQVLQQLTQLLQRRWRSALRQPARALIGSYGRRPKPITISALSTCSNVCCDPEHY